MPKRFAPLLFMFFIAFPSAARSAEKIYELNFQTIYGGGHVLDRELYRPWADKIAEKSRGRLIIHRRNPGALVPTQDIEKAVISGTVDIGIFSARRLPRELSHSLAFSVPYIAKESIHASGLFWRAYSELPDVKAQWDALGKVLTLWGSDRSGFFSTKGPVLSPQDLIGKRVLVWENTQAEQVKAWGGIPIRIAIENTLQAMQRGIGDIFYGPLPVGIPYDLISVAKDVSVFPSSSITMGIVVNHEAWNKLPEDLRALLSENAGEDFSRESGEILYAQTVKDLEKMKDSGCNIYILSEKQQLAFKQLDQKILHDFLLHELNGLGIHDPEAELRRALRLSSQTPGANGVFYTMD